MVVGTFLDRAIGRRGQRYFNEVINLVNLTPESISENGNILPAYYKFVITIPVVSLDIRLKSTPARQRTMAGSHGLANKPMIVTIKKQIAH